MNGVNSAEQEEGDNLLDILSAAFKNFPVALTLVLNEGETYFHEGNIDTNKKSSKWKFHLAQEFFHHFRFN